MGSDLMPCHFGVHTGRMYQSSLKYLAYGLRCAVEADVRPCLLTSERQRATRGSLWTENGCAEFEMAAE